MAISQEDMYYTWLAQGVAGSPYDLRATEIQQRTFPPNPLLPAMPDKTIDVYTSYPATVIQTWNDDSAYYSYCNSGLTTVFFYPTNQINDIHHLQYVGSGGGQISVQACKEDGTVVSSYPVSLSPLVYESLSVDPAPDNTRYPVSLVVYAKQFGSALKVGFGIAGHLSDQVAVNDYPSANGYLYDCGVGDISSNLSYMLLDESMITDREGGAPTGEPDGGGGFYDYPFGAIPEPQLPTISVCDTGMVSLWNTNASQMYQLANKLWNSNFFDNIIKNFASPMDNIISLHVVPFSVYGGTQANIHIGNYDTEIPSNMLSTSYFKIDCGIIELTGAYQTFADYAPFTDIQLYLPYIGIVPITPDDIIDGALNVKYNIDVFSGSCVAYIMIRKRGTWTCVNQYTGNISTAYPITSANYTNVYMGIAQSAFKALTAGALFGALGAGSVGIGAVGGMTPELAGIGAGAMAGSSLQGALTSRPTYQRSGGIGASAGLMGVQKPYLIISKPNFIQANNFRETKGYVSNLSCVIGNESGYISASVNNEQLTDIDCTTLERDMIKKCLAEGVYI